MSGKKHDVIVDLMEPTKAFDHQRRVAARQVGAATTVEEQRVAADQSSVDHEALAARGVAGGVHELDLDVADTDDVT